MLGHQVFKHLKGRHDVRVTLRQDLASYREVGLFSDADAYAGVDVRAIERVVEVIAEFGPEAIVNCVGIVKQRSAAKAALPSLEINALLPHRLALLARTAGIRLVHVSTDCVFSGRSGRYRESDTPDADDLYGRTKYLGELAEPRCITLRTSIIGFELSGKTGLLEWFLSQRGGTVKGFARAIFSGVTTPEMARVIEKLLVDHPHASGLYHVSAEPISKHDLLVKLNDVLGLGITVVRDEEFHCDRSLDSTRFRSEFGYRPPSWDDMVSELVHPVSRDGR